MSEKDQSIDVSMFIFMIVELRHRMLYRCFTRRVLTHSGIHQAARVMPFCQLPEFYYHRPEGEFWCKAAALSSSLRTHADTWWTLRKIRRALRCVCSHRRIDCRCSAVVAFEHDSKRTERWETSVGIGDASGVGTCGSALRTCSTWLGIRWHGEWLEYHAWNRRPFE